MKEQLGGIPPQEPIDEPSSDDFRSGDDDRISNAYNRLRPIVISFLHYCGCHNPDVLDDIFQESMIRVWGRIDTYNDERGEKDKKFRLWVLSISRNALIDHWRGERCRPQRADYNNDVFSILDVMQSDDLSPEEHVIANETAKEATQKVEVLLGILPEAQRRAIEWTYFAGFTNKQVSEVTDTPLGTVKTHIRLGLKKMRTTVYEVDPQISSD